MKPRFVEIDRETPMLLPPDLRDWVPDNDIVHFILEAIDRISLENFHYNKGRSGSKQYPPQMMLALLVYCYSHGIFSSRKIQRATYSDVIVRYVTGNTHPDHDTICKFRRENADAFSEAFVSILELAKELKVLKLGNVSIDGTHIKAHASIDKNVTHERAVEIRNSLKQDISNLLEQVEQVNTQSEDTQLPEEIARREKLVLKMDAAIEELEKRAKVRDKKADLEYARKVAERKQKEEETGKKSRGPKLKPPKTGPKNSDEQVNLTDKDARIMRKNKRSGYTESYNAQAVVDADGSQLIVGAYVSQSASDGNEMQNGIDSVPSRIGIPKAGLWDAGYASVAGITDVESLGIEVYVSVHREDAHSERLYDYRPKKVTQRPTKNVKHPKLVEMKAKLESDEGKALYSKRNCTVETAFGIIKSVMGFRGFSLRGVAKTSAEWTLVCLSYNMKLLHNQILKQ